VLSLTYVLLLVFACALLCVIAAVTAYRLYRPNR